MRPTAHLFRPTVIVACVLFALLGTAASTPAQLMATRVIAGVAPTEEGGGATSVGDNCFLMVGSHVGHDCHIGNKVVFANNVLLAGHVSVGDNVVFGGSVAVRQFVRIGEGAMITGMTGLRADVIPWGMVEGRRGNLVGLNVIGMRRRGLSKADIHRVRAAYRALFFGEGEFRTRLDRVEAEYGADALVGKVIAFIRAGKRPFTMAIRRAEQDVDA